MLAIAYIFGRIQIGGFMINILNLNPSLDYFVYCDDFKMNQTNHSRSETVSVGGKGSNVGTLLSNLEIESIMHGFIGGFVGNYIIDEMKKLSYVKNQMIDTDQLTRINVKLNYQGETEINGVGQVIPEKFIDELEKDLNRLGPDDILVMTGRVANGMSFDWYKKMGQKMKEQGVDFVLDINHEVFKEILDYNPLLIKPNEDELKNIFGHKGDLEEKDLIYYGKEMLKKGAKHVIISLGSKGSLFLYDDKVYQSENLKEPVLGTVGAGDSMVAGFIAEYQMDKDPLAAYKMAQACGNATAFSKGIASKGTIERVHKQIKIREIKNGS